MGLFYQKGLNLDNQIIDIFLSNRRTLFLYSCFFETVVFGNIDLQLITSSFTKIAKDINC